MRKEELSCRSFYGNSFIFACMELMEDFLEERITLALILSAVVIVGPPLVCIVNFWLGFVFYLEFYDR